MNIKVTIEFTDEFDQKQIAVSGVEDVANDLYDNHLEFIFNYVKQAVAGLGFSESVVEDYLYPEGE
jgi:hypothetical protein